MRQRLIQPEILDTLPFELALPGLRDLARINRWLGGNRILASLLARHLKAHPNATVLDVGAANGETIRWLSARYPEASFIAFDASEKFVRHAPLPRAAGDVFRWPLRRESVDIVICSLFLHHFDDDAVRVILKTMEATARRAVVVVDLQRHWLARWFLPATRPVAGWNSLTVHDGTRSVQAAFTANELRRLAPHARVRTHFPWFRLSLEIEINRSQ